MIMWGSRNTTAQESNENAERGGVALHAVVRALL